MKKDDLDLKKIFPDMIPDYNFMGINVFTRNWMPKDKILFISKQLTHPKMDKEEKIWIIKNATQ